jgi:hypothetical protein
MKKLLLMLIGLLGLTSGQVNAQFVAYQDIKPILQKLKNGEMPYGFFGLTSNGTDCLYFTYNNGIFSLEYEVIAEPQKQVAVNFMSWAKEHGLEVVTTTYGNKPEYHSFSAAPVYKIDLDSSIESAYQRGFSFFSNIFEYKESKSFEVVP